MHRTFTLIIAAGALLLGGALDGRAGHPGRSGSLDETAPPYNWTALHVAARDGDVGRVQALLDGGAGLEAREHLGRTPLHIAVQWGHLEVARLLLDRGAHVNAVDRWKITPLRRARLMEQTRGMNLRAMADLLRERGGTE
jgi:uncharacterized protein